MLVTADLAFLNASYCGEATLAAGADHDTLRYNMFHTPFGESLGVLLVFNVGGFRVSSHPETISDHETVNTPQRICAEWLKRRFDVVVASAPIARSANATLQSVQGIAPLSDAVTALSNWAETDPGGIHYGPAYLKGNGMFVPKTDSIGTLPFGYTGGPLHPASDPARINCHMAACMMVQHFKRVIVPLYAGKHIAIWGGSAGGALAQWVTLHTNLALYHFPLATVGQQDAEDTRSVFNLVAFYGTQSNWSWMPNSMYLSSVAKSPTSGGSTLYDEQSATLAEKPAGTLPFMSSIVYAQDVSVLAANRQLRVHVVSGGPGDWATQGPPYTTANGNQNSTTHDGVQGLAIAVYLLPGGNVRWITFFKPNAINQTGIEAAGIKYKVVEPTPTAYMEELLGYLLGTATVPAQLDDEGDLITVPQVRARLQNRVELEPRLLDFRDTVVAMWIHATAREWTQQTDRVVMLRPDTTRAQVIALDLWPVSSITKIEERDLTPGAGWEELDADSYMLLHERTIRKLTGDPWMPLVRITYSGGYTSTTCPPDVREALLLQVEFMLSRMSHDKIAVKSQNFEGGGGVFEAADTHPYFAARAKVHRRKS